MVEISLFLEPVAVKSLELFGRPGQQRMLDSMLIYTEKEKFPSLDGVRIALLGVAEERNAIRNEGCMLGPKYIRKSFYTLFSHWPDLKIADLGDLRPGHAINDTYFALSQVVEALIQQRIIPIVMGGSQDLTYALYQAYENTGQLVNILSIDSIFDLGEHEDDFHSQAYLSRMIMHQPNYLFNFTNLGYQTHYVDHMAVDLMKNLLFDAWRLGVVRSNMEESEPALRNADIVSFDIGAIRAADAPGNGNAGPNGFTGDEACRLARYAGLSDKVSCFGLFEFNPSYDRNNFTADLAAQIIWYFIEGVAKRAYDIPTHAENGFIRYIVQIEGQEEDLVFLNSKKTDRWWIDLSFGKDDRKKFERHHFVPCSRKDYELALSDEIPDRWWQCFQKLM